MNGNERASYELDVSPHPDKIGRDVFQTMLDQLRTFNPSLVFGTEPAALPVGHAGITSTPWLQYWRLQEYGKQFLNALSVISRQPLKELKAERMHLPLQKVRRVDRQTVMTALGVPQLFPILGLPDSGAKPVSDLPHFDVPVARETLDTAANRCIATMAHAVCCRTVQLKRELKEIVNRKSAPETRTPLANRWPRRNDLLNQIEKCLQQLQKISPMADVTRREVSAAGLNAVSADPAYSRAYSLGWQILRLGVDDLPQPERLWISPTWEIYERWCFIQLANALKKKYKDLKWSFSMHPKTNWDLKAAAFTGRKDGKQNIELLLQPNFPAWKNSHNLGFQSISGARKPDIVLKQNDGAISKWYVFDAKYRTARRNVLEAMASAHIYRDALRYNGRRPDRVLLLVPQAGGARWLEEPDFIRQHGVGVHAISPETNPRSIFELLSDDFATGST